MSRLAIAVSLGSAALLLSGCVAVPANGTGPIVSSVSIDNCGTKFSVDKAPERVITIKSTSTEMLLALGLGDRIIGTGFQDGPLPEEWADSDIPVLSEMVPGQEAVLEEEPDFVYAGWESNFSPEGAGDRAELQDLGVNTYVSPAACKEAAYKPAKLDFDEIFDEITEVAMIFEADPSTLIEAQKETVAGIDADERGLSALWYSSGTDVPYVGAGIGAPQLVLETLGLENIAGDIDDTWSPFAWEAVVDANPDVIVLVDATWNTAESKIALLESNPATKNLDAVKNARYLYIPFAAGEAGVRTAPAAADLADQLKALDF
ncbi:putative F420-0 ABC transporter substrate-binding protein [Glaciihabitans arcticus]|uniref:putative F420-0 ABC transporter substrate-binding protein n=1 Tax=Glaciihabitans arcticus TaxID=2668039 RepID=UPI001F024E52|nr:putative F420-0 ABC transporter substrate-binding protein [Glaciihabitans arcticus]